MGPRHGGFEEEAFGGEMAGVATAEKLPNSLSQWRRAWRGAAHKMQGIASVRTTLPNATPKTAVFCCKPGLGGPLHTLHPDSRAVWESLLAVPTTHGSPTAR